MTKQEDIREGIRTIIDDPLVYIADKPVEYTDKILSYLHSQGVVVKVNRELPPRAAITIVEGSQTIIIPIKKLSELGYEAVEPLIEE